ncbi:transposase [Streptomyces sp. NPDC096105]|uniref:transposase n=1 Tax=Streptomyces sp. NPDC096105 TaxID=3366074 RepID=UPI0038281E43
MITDVSVSESEGQAVGPAGVDDELVAQLVARAQADGPRLTGEGGLPQQLTKRVLESALEGELTDHLGHEHGEKGEGGRENYRNGRRGKTVSPRSARWRSRRPGTGRARSIRCWSRSGSGGSARSTRWSCHCPPST